MPWLPLPAPKFKLNAPMIQPDQDWNAIAVMDALTGRCFVQTFDTNPMSAEPSASPFVSSTDRLVVMREEGEEGGRAWLGGIWRGDIARGLAFEKDIEIQDSRELQLDLCTSDSAARAAIRQEREQGRGVRGTELQQAVVQFQLAHRRMAVWPRRLPELVSDSRRPLVLEPLEAVLQTRPCGEVAAYVVCEGYVHALFNRSMQAIRCSPPITLARAMRTYTNAIRIFAPDQLRPWLTTIG
jgi:hypothetical protein